MFALLPTRWVSRELLSEAIISVELPPYTSTPAAAHRGSGMIFINNYSSFLPSIVAMLYIANIIRWIRVEAILVENAL